MAFPVIKFNNSTGSDTQASGAGPDTAVFGTGASLASSTSVDLSADAPDLSGVATDGSACLWVLTSSGRQFSKITGVDNGTKIVTVETAYGVTESGRTWAIGGKRATMHNTNSLLLFTADARQSWEVELEYTGTNYMHRSSGTGGITMHANTAGGISAKGFTLRGTGSQKPTLELRPSTPGTAITFQSYAYIEDLIIYMIKPSDIFSTAFNGASNFSVLRCAFTSNDSNQVGPYIAARDYLVVRHCYFENLTNGSSVGITISNSNPANYQITDSFFYNIRVCIDDPSAYPKGCTVERNIFHTGNGSAYRRTGASSAPGAISIRNNTFYNNAGLLINAIHLGVQGTIVGNIFANSSAYGINMGTTSALDSIVIEDYNHFYNNTSGSRQYGSLGPNDTEGIDPMFADAANKDMRITNPLLKGKGAFGDSTLLYNTLLNVDPGAAQGNWGTAGGGNTRGGFVN